MRWRVTLLESDLAAVRSLVAKTGFFSEPELDIAVELVQETLQRGPASGYEFVLTDDPDKPGELLGYTCYGLIPGTESSYDLYWIAVTPSEQGKGLGGELLRETERLAKNMQATRMFVDTSGREQYGPTRAFYERMGYLVAARLDDFFAPDDDKVIYGKVLWCPVTEK